MTRDIASLIEALRATLNMDRHAATMLATAIIEIIDSRGKRK